MVEYTKGKWKLLKVGSLPEIREVKMPYGEASTYRAAVVIQNENGLVTHKICDLDFGYGHKEDEANARLIAAAPDLLAACKMAEDWIRSSIAAIHRPAKLDKALMDAIAKATKSLPPE